MLKTEKNLIKNNIISLIKEKRKELQLSQEELADRSGVAKNTISSIETGQYNCLATTFVKILSALNLNYIDIENLLREKE